MIHNWTIYIYICRYLEPNWPSMFEGRPSKTRPKLQAKQGSPFMGDLGIYISSLIFSTWVELNFETHLQRVLKKPITFFFPRSTHETLSSRSSARRLNVGKVLFIWASIVITSSWTRKGPETNPNEQSSKPIPDIPWAMVHPGWLMEIRKFHGLWNNPGI